MQKKIDLVQSGVFDQYCSDRYNLVENLVEDQISGFDPVGRSEEELRDLSLDFVLSHNWKEIDKASAYDLSVEDFNACESLRQAKSKQRKSLSDHLQFMVENCPDNCELVFLTVTESPELQEKYNEKERRHRITRLLSEICEDYDGNVDFGKDTEREHFHFVAMVPKNQITEKSVEKVDKIGRKRVYKVPVLEGLSNAWGSYIGVERLKTSQKSIKKTSAYIGKLTSHALKATAGKRIVARNSEYKKMLKAKRQEAKEVEERLQNLFGPDGYVVVGTI